MRYTENKSSSRREDWETPPDLFNYLDRLFDFEVDLAATEENKKCDRFVGPYWDFLSMDHEAIQERCWCNPPYGRAHNAQWAQALMKIQNVVVLHQASVGAAWFHPFWEHADYLVFLTDRIQFVGAPNKAQFDSVLVIKWNFRGDTPYLVDALSLLGHVVYMGGVTTQKGF